MTTWQKSKWQCLMRDFTKGIIQPGRKCHNWAYSSTDLKIHEVIQRHFQPQDYIIFADGFSIRRHWSGWGFAAKTAEERVGACDITTCNIRMKTEVVTTVVTWLVEQQIRSAVTVMDSQSMLLKIKRGMLCRELANILASSQFAGLTWNYHPGHAGVHGN